MPIWIEFATNVGRSWAGGAVFREGGGLHRLPLFVIYFGKEGGFGLTAN